jgi:ABC-type nitrate/sulfonate/bicarbonate transport system permease component
MKASTVQRHQRGACIASIASLILFIGSWQIVTATEIVPDDVLPRFSDVAVTWWQLLISGELVRQTASSLSRQAAGFAAALVCGVSLGIVMARHRMVDDLVGPLTTVILPIPKAALIPLVMLWFGIGDAAKTIIVFLGTILPILVSTYHGAASVDHVYIWSARSMGDDARTLLWRVVFRAALPEIMSGIRMGLIISLIVLVGAEMLAGQGGLGWLVFFTLDSGAYRVTYAAMLTIAVSASLTTDCSAACCIGRSKIHECCRRPAERSIMAPAAALLLGAASGKARHAAASSIPFCCPRLPTFSPICGGW